MFSSGRSSVKAPITNIQLKDLKNLAGGEKSLHEAIRKRLEEFNDDPKKAFSKENPLYKPLKNGDDGPIVRSVRLISNDQKSGLLINDNKAVVDQDSMIRLDIFSKPNQKGREEFFIVPIYAYHFSQKKLPNKAIIGGKPESEWTELDDSYKFIFSLYPNDLMKIVKNDKEVFGYYVKCNRAIAAIDVESNDSSKYWESQGIKTVDRIEKYVVDVLGRHHLVKNEKRQEINR